MPFSAGISGTCSTVIDSDGMSSCDDEMTGLWMSVVSAVV